MLSFHMLQQSSNGLSLKLTLELLSLKHFLCMPQDLIALKWFLSRVILGDLISPQHKILGQHSHLPSPSIGSIHAHDMVRLLRVNLLNC